MKIPRDIDNALRRRTRAAESFLDADLIVSSYIDEVGADVDSYDYYGGVESIVNSRSSEKRIREALKKIKE